MIPNGRFPFIHLVPKDPLENVRFRARVAKEASNDRSLQRTIWSMCAADPLFYVNAFMWTQNPKKTAGQRILPFVTWPYQDYMIFDMLEAIRGGEDRGYKKTREMGFTWVCMGIFLWSWQFEEQVLYGVASRTEDEVDAKTDDALFPKIDFALERLPAWLKPAYDRTALHIGNEWNGSSIDGDATTGDMFRGGRRTAIWLDEFASVPNGSEVTRAVHDVTNSVFYCSTSKGTGTEFYKQLQNPALKKVEYYWTVHPEKNLGMYRWKDDQEVEKLDPNWDYDPKYKYIRDGRVRSPWYDKEERRRGSRLEMAQEIDGDDLAAGSQWFDPVVLERIEQHDIREPLWAGDVKVDNDGNFVDLVPDSRGFLRLWIDPHNIPKGKPFCAGVDTSAGAGVTNSNFSAGDPFSGEKVVDYSRSDLLPEQFALRVSGLGKWLNDALLVVERNGPGSILLRKLHQLGYTNLYFQRNEQSEYRRETAEKVAGWMPTPKAKEILLGDLRSDLATGKFKTRNLADIQEAREYVRNSAGQPVHAGQLNREDPSGAISQHGDRVIGDALLRLGMNDRYYESGVEESKGAPQPGSVAWIKEQTEPALSEDEGWAP